MGSLKKILLISDSESLYTRLREMVAERFEVIHFNIFSIDDFCDLKEVDFILCDYLLLGDFKSFAKGPELFEARLSALKENLPSARILLVVDHRKIEEASPLLERGVHNLLQVPFTKEILELRLKREEEVVLYRASVSPSISQEKSLSSNNPEMTKVLEEVRKVAKSRSTILLTGESGTGKSLLAREIHRNSDRKDKAFIEVHCGSLPENLVESELFGHEKGAFTGAIKKKIGKFELANNGTLFLDEIGTISKSTQIKLLQALQERFINRVGGEVQIPLNIRIIAATNEDLKKNVAQGTFREDLYFRLKVMQFQLPPLRDRKEDLESVCSSLLEKLERVYDKGIHKISSEVLSLFHNYSFPGNIRELENILERAYILEEGSEISPDHIPIDLFPGTPEMVKASPLFAPKHLSLSDARKLAMESFERKYLTDLLVAHRGKVSSMAKEAQVTARQLHKLMAKYQIKAKNFALTLEEENS